MIVAEIKKDLLEFSIYIIGKKDYSQSEKSAVLAAFAAGYKFGMKNARLFGTVDDKTFEKIHEDHVLRLEEKLGANE